MTKSDPFFNTDRCVERLYKDFYKHNNIIVASDHDDTCFPFKDKEFTFPKVIEILKRVNKIGSYVVIFTASDKSRYPEIRKFYDDLNVKIASINENPFPMEFGNYGKIYYNIFLDDKAGLAQAYEILDKTLAMIEKDKENK